MSARAHNVTTHQIITRDGVALIADVAGEVGAPCVVLAHGGGQTRFSWQATLQVRAVTEQVTSQYEPG